MPQRDKKKRGPKLSDCFVMCVCVVFNQILSDHLLESIRQMWTEIHLQIHLIVPLCSTIKCKLDHRRTERRTQTWQWDNCLTGANENCGKKRKKPWARIQIISTRERCFMMRLYTQQAVQWLSLRAISAEATASPNVATYVTCPHFQHH